MIKTKTCHYLVCDSCREPIADEYEGGIPHFDSPEEAQKACLGDYDLGVVVFDQHFCHDCKGKPHAPIPEPGIPHMCVRCGGGVDEHDEAAVSL